MANQYNTQAYLQDTTRPVASQWSSISTVGREVGLVYRQQISLTIPAAAALASTTPDRIYLMDVPGSIFTGAASVRLSRLYIANSANIGGTTTFNLGWLNGLQTAFGTALTTLQSATALDVAIATLLAATPVTAADSLVMTIASAGPSTTLTALTGFVEFSITRT